jgi:hypothetical protein
MKKRGVASPNRADGLAYTFAIPIQSKAQAEQTDRIGATPGKCASEYEPMADPSIQGPGIAPNQQPTQLGRGRMLSEYNPFTSFGDGR